jgi:integrase
MTGMREQEVMYTHWSDVNLVASTVRVSHKPDRGWTPKPYKEREIPIPSKLVKSLKGWKTKSDKTCSLVFPTAACNPKLDFLDGLKAVAERAKLDKRKLLASPVPSYVRDLVAMGRSRSAYGSTMAGSLRYGVDNALFEAVAQPACAG